MDIFHVAALMLCAYIGIWFIVLVFFRKQDASSVTLMAHGSGSDIREGFDWSSSASLMSPQACSSEACSTSKTQMFKFNPVVEQPSIRSPSCYYIAPVGTECDAGMVNGMAFQTKFFGSTLDNYAAPKHMCVYSGEFVCPSPPPRQLVMSMLPVVSSSSSCFKVGPVQANETIDCNAKGINQFTLSNVNQQSASPQDSKWSYRYACATDGPLTGDARSVTTPWVANASASVPNTDGRMGSTILMNELDFDCGDDGILTSYGIEDQTPDAKVQLFEHIGFGGRSVSLGAGRYDMNDIGLPNDVLS